jgi:hypothetical protein
MANPTVCPVCGTALPMEPLDDVAVVCPKCAVVPDEPTGLPARAIISAPPSGRSQDHAPPPRHASRSAPSAPPLSLASAGKDSPVLWAFVQLGIVFCGLANIPALANTIWASTLVVQSMDDPTVVAKYLEPSRPDPVDALVQVAISLLTILFAFAGLGLCCLAPAKPAAHSAQVALALVFVCLFSMLVTAVGFASVAVDRTKPFVGYAVALAAVSALLIVAAEVYHLLFFKNLATSLAAKRLERTASFTLKTLGVAIGLTFAAGFAVYMYVSYAPFLRAQGSPGFGMTQQKPQVPDTTVPLLILAPIIVWVLFFLMYFKLLFSAFSAIGGRPRAPQPAT